MSKNLKTYRVHGYEKTLKAPMFVYRERLKLIEELLEELLYFSMDGNIILVEGKRDLASLRKLGINGRIEFVTHHPLTGVCEKVAATGKNIVILTDWDRRGVILEKKIAGHLENYGIRIEHRLRKRILSLVQKEIKDVESLYTHISILRQIADPEYHYNNTYDNILI
ncbi:MAG: toprim domain-containing protein [Methanomethylovorans sp.]|uniref:toprim domain-containing protein n=1 Tax=Methanomethylovorans sp. TaxID=2758717 RepID=UPI000A4BF016|nr:toprim domain-containing protein [Methanomethylovorans sp.]